MKIEETESVKRLRHLLMQPEATPDLVRTDQVIANSEHSKLVAGVIDHRLRTLGWAPTQFGAASEGGKFLATCQMAIAWRGIPDAISTYFVIPRREKFEEVRIWGEEIRHGGRVVILEAAMHSDEEVGDAVAAAIQRGAHVIGIMALIWVPPAHAPSSAIPEKLHSTPFHAIYNAAELCQRHLPMTGT